MPAEKKVKMLEVAKKAYKARCTALPLLRSSLLCLRSNLPCELHALRACCTLHQLYPLSGEGGCADDSGALLGHPREGDASGGEPGKNFSTVH